MEIQVIKANIDNDNKENIMSKKLNVAAYCRVSTDEEDQVKSYNSMVQYYTEYIANNPEWNFVGVYADKGMTGTKAENRVQFQQLINDSLDGKIDMIIAKSLSRFARNTLDTLKYVRMLKARNIAVFFEAEHINTLKDGEFLMTILSSVAQQEVENTSNNVKKGLRMKMKRGELIGFNRCLGYGYNSEDKSIYIIEEEAKIIRTIFDQYVQGYGGTAIANELNSRGYKTLKGGSFTHSTIIDIIKNEKYKGDVLLGKTYTTDPITKRRLANNGEYDKIYIKDHHEPIIEPEIFDAANAIREKRAVSKAKVKTYGERMKYSRQYCFSSKLYCEFCGSILSRRTWHSSSEYSTTIWQCMKKTKKGASCCPESKGVPEKSIQDAFVDVYNEIFLNASKSRNELLKAIEQTLHENSSKSKLISNTKDITDLRERRKNLLKGYTEGKIDDESYSEYDNELKVKIARLTKENEELVDKVDDELLFQEKMQLIKDFLDSDQKMEEFDEAIFETCVDRIMVGGYAEDGSPEPYRIDIIFKNNDDNYTIDDVKRKYKVDRKRKASEKIKDIAKGFIHDNLCIQAIDDVKKLLPQTQNDTC